MNTLETVLMTLFDKFDYQTMRDSFCLFDEDFDLFVAFDLTEKEGNFFFDMKMSNYLCQLTMFNFIFKAQDILALSEKFDFEHSHHFQAQVDDENIHQIASSFFQNLSNSTYRHHVAQILPSIEKILLEYSLDSKTTQKNNKMKI
jgi:hypothetical protein